MKPLLKDITAYVPLVSYFSTAASDAQRREIYSGKLPSDGQWNRIEHDLAISPQLRTGDTGVTAEARHYGYVSYVKFTASTVQMCIRDRSRKRRPDTAGPCGPRRRMCASSWTNTGTFCGGITGESGMMGQVHLLLLQKMV